MNEFINNTITRPKADLGSNPRHAINLSPQIKTNLITLGTVNNSDSSQRLQIKMNKG